ncbi:carbohydrate ABC transporter permease [Actinoallomurus iriomotensis]|uniref:Sugar ABC transporter permease n=1 Tax=Actinoallomurus iriomotensis TaxID=478107 RepID=A0A9W6VTA2_9ACTN|nr:sugar ABC transporter permease [Actinoallomurus iriomotensis]GLY78924.1 sugar ABC transporter permease [Actinoallomurus iriomotensis]
MAAVTTAATRVRQKKRKGTRSREARAAYGFIGIWIVGFLVFTLGPMIASLVLSFTDYNAISSPHNVGWANYRQMFSDPKVGKALANTLVYAVIYVPAAMVVALALAMVLNRVGRASGFFRTVFYLPVMTPPVAAGALFLLLLNGNQGLLNRTLHLVGINGPNWTTDTAWVKPGLALTMLWGVGGMVVIYLAALRQVPKDLYEAASLDGAGAWMRFRKITLPMISGALFFTLIVQTISALQMFDQAYTMFFGGQQNSTYSNDAALFYVIYLFQQGFGFLHMGYASALAWLLFIVIMIITAIQVRVSRRFVYYEGERD